jgi:hypothetical protein
MKIKKILLILFIFFFIAGCGDYFMVCSIYPFYLEKNINLADDIVGNWNAKPIKCKSREGNSADFLWKIADSTCVWNIKRTTTRETITTKTGNIDGDFKWYYIVKLTGNNPDTTFYQFKLVVFWVNKVIYGDFTPINNAAIQNSQMAKDNYLSVHTLARLSHENNELKVSWLDYETMKSMIEEKRVRIKYRWIADLNRLVLSASSAELTAMIERYGSDKRFIDWDNQPAMMKLTRVNTSKP